MAFSLRTTLARRKEARFARRRARQASITQGAIRAEEAMARDEAAARAAAAPDEVDPEA